jgi:hypothetical protein
MRLGKIKIVFLLIVLVFLCGTILINIIFDPLKSTRKELGNFYRKEFKNFSIDKIINVPYPTGKGNYYLFSSVRQQEYFPILLEYGDDESYDLFKVGTIIDKPALSVNVTLHKGKETHTVKIRNPEDEKGDIWLPVPIFGSILILMLLLPNRFFENVLEIWFNDNE